MSETEQMAKIETTDKNGAGVKLEFPASLFKEVYTDLKHRGLIGEDSLMDLVSRTGEK